MPRSNRNHSAAEAKSVLLFDSDPERCSVLKRGLLDSGYRLSNKLTQASVLLKQVETHQPDILVIGIDEPDDVILQQLLLIHEYCPIPVIMFAEKEAPKLIKTIVKAGVNGFVVNDIQAHRIRPIINIATARFIENQKLRDELEDTKTKLLNRKIIDRAKGLLMDTKKLSEDEAYRSLRKMAMDRGLSLSMVSETVIDVLA